MIWEYYQKVNDVKKEYNEEFSLSEDIINLLHNRSLYGKEEIEKYLNPEFSDLRDPYDFENMEAAVSKILECKFKNGRIFVYGDYDVDGITATAFLVKALRDANLDADYYIPNRMDEGYGLNKKALSCIKDKGGTLVITVDVGINSNEEVAYAKELGLEIIITDHHKMIGDSENGVVIINPKVSGNYMFKELSGAGVALKLSEALYIKEKLPLEIIYSYLDLVMLGTVADVVSMTDENRVIIKKGLETIKDSKIKGFSYLFRYLKLDHKEINTTDVSFYIAPMLNALGRMSDPKIGVKFFLENDEFSIYNMIEEMKKANKQRRIYEQNIYSEIIETIDENLNGKSYIFLKSDKWHPGVIGVVASKLVLRYNIPVILISMKDGYGKASCRSVNGINIFEILKEYSDKFVRFGGHDLASGFIIKSEYIDELENNLELSLENLHYKRKSKKIKIDLKIEIENIDNEFIENIKRLSPFGSGNAQPIFYTKGIKFENIIKFGVGKQHFKTNVSSGENKINSVAFNLTYKLREIDTDELCDIVYYPEKVYIDNRHFIQLKIKDIKNSETYDTNEKILS